MCESFQSGMKGVSSLEVQYEQKRKAESQEEVRRPTWSRRAEEAEGELGSNYRRRMLTL